VNSKKTFEKVDVLKGHDFSRAGNASKSTWASALKGIPGVEQEINQRPLAVPG
jgi:hypothetical protein